MPVLPCHHSLHWIQFDSDASIQCQVQFKISFLWRHAWAHYNIFLNTSSLASTKMGSNVSMHVLIFCHCWYGLHRVSANRHILRLQTKTFHTSSLFVSLYIHPPKLNKKCYFSTSLIHFFQKTRVFQTRFTVCDCSSHCFWSLQVS